MKFSSIKKEFKWVTVALIISGLISFSAPVLFAQDKVSESAPTTQETKTKHPAKRRIKVGDLWIFFF